MAEKTKNLDNAEENYGLDAETIKIIAEIAKIVGKTIKYAIRTKPYGIVHDSYEFVENGKKIRLVWDYIIWNELTLEDTETGEKRSIFTSFSDKETKEKFDKIVANIHEQ